MHTTITSIGFQKKVKKKYDSDYIESIIEKIAIEPRIGKKFSAVNNIFKLDLGYTLNKKYQYNLLYCYQGKNQPIFVVNIFKKNENDLLSKVISSLIAETTEDYLN